MPLDAERPVVHGFFSLTHVRNRGGSFSFLRDSPDPVRLAVFVGGSVVAIFVIVAYFRRLARGDRVGSLALGLCLGGVVGNLVDRVLRGGVVDFLRFYLWRGYQWPDFNLADSAIVVGVTIWMLRPIVDRRRWQASGGAP
jgi:signal peptidase II